MNVTLPAPQQLYEDKIDELNAQLEAVQADYSSRIGELNTNISTEQVNKRGIANRGLCSDLLVLA